MTKYNERQIIGCSLIRKMEVIGFYVFAKLFFCNCVQRRIVWEPTLTLFASSCFFESHQKWLKNHSSQLWLFSAITTSQDENKNKKPDAYNTEVVNNRRTTYPPLLERVSLFLAHHVETCSRARCLFCLLLYYLAQRTFPPLSLRISCILQSHNLQNM